MWFFSANEARFLFSTDGCSEKLDVLRFSGNETLGSNYLFEIDVVCDSHSLDSMALQHKTACLTLLDATEPRYIHGIVLSTAHLKQDSRHHHYRFWLAPQAELLNYRTNQRIFQNKSVPEIIQAVWHSAGLDPAAIRFQIQKNASPLIYCVHPETV
jgi:type VI secretion system secreted protein VgrG